MSSSLRLASLLPSATEILYELGLGENLVAVSTDCDYPPEVEKLPSLTASELDETLSSREIDRAVKEHQHGGRSLYHIDQQRLERLNPDIVFTQEQCEVCAPAFDEVQSACRVLAGEPTVVSLEAHTLQDILDGIRTVGELTGVQQRAEELIASLRDRIESLTVPDPEEVGSRVLTLEWLDPYFAGGHWIPEIVKLLGAESFLEPGERSREVSVDELREYDPELTVLMPCGFGLERTVREGRELLNESAGAAARKDYGDTVYAVDGLSYFSRPGPRVVRGFEIMASILRPETVDESVLPDNAVEKLV